MKEELVTANVLLADDHPLLMEGFSKVLESYGVTVVGQTMTPEGAVKQYEVLQPNVLILDIRFGERMTGLDAARRVLSKFPDANIVFLSQFDQDPLIKEAYRIGARAFLTKSCTASDLRTAIKRASEGEKYFVPQVAERLANLAVSGDLSPQSRLDEREIEVFKFMAHGFTNQEIAEKLSLSLKTISNTSLTIKDKLSVHRPADITRLAVKHGLIEP